MTYGGLVKKEVAAAYISISRGRDGEAPKGNLQLAAGKNEAGVYLFDPYESISGYIESLYWKSIAIKNGQNAGEEVRQLCIRLRDDNNALCVFSVGWEPDSVVRSAVVNLEDPKADFTQQFTFFSYLKRNGAESSTILKIQQAHLEDTPQGYKGSLFNNIWSELPRINDTKARKRDLEKGMSVEKAGIRIDWDAGFSPTDPGYFGRMIERINAKAAEGKKVWGAKVAQAANYHSEDPSEYFAYEEESYEPETSSNIHPAVRTAFDAYAPSSPTPSAQPIVMPSPATIPAPAPKVVDPALQAKVEWGTKNISFPNAGDLEIWLNSICGVAEVSKMSTDALEKVYEQLKTFLPNIDVDYEIPF